MTRSLGLTLLLALAAGCQQNPTLTRAPEPAPALPPSLAERQAVRNAKAAVGNLSHEQIGMIDPVMKQLLAEQSALQDQLADARGAGLMDENPKVKQISGAFDRSTAKVEKYAAEWRGMQVKTLSDRSSDELSRLQATFTGPCDLYLDPSEIQARKPAIASATFEDVSDVSGRRMLKFSGPGGETWLVDPARIVAVRRAR
jgi:hypothetical protein